MTGWHSLYGLVVAQRMTRSQIERLGVRLVSTSPPAQEDLDTLHELLVVYADALADAVVRVHEHLGIVPTSRVKNTGTILEKLERFGGSWLKSIEDLAGMRIVGGLDRDGQDRLVEQLVALFDHGARPPKVVDRREHPVQGYTAVHVIVFVDGLPVEIQVRTRLQHEWADLFEKLADRVGRGIRYGEPPDHWLTENQRERLSPTGRNFYLVAYRLMEETVRLAKDVGEEIRRYDAGHQAFPNDNGLVAHKARLDGALNGLRTLVDEMTVQVRASVRPPTSN